MSRLGVAAVLLASVPAVAAPIAGHGTSIDRNDQMTPVIGGTLVPAGKWPDAVAVLGQGSCTGTLIAPDVVLTAGHCEGAQMTEVIANTTDYNGAGGIRSTIKSITAYPNWETSYDVSVIVLNTPITGVTPRAIGTACTFTEGFTDNTMVHLVGFGLTDTAGMGNNTKLNETMAPVTDSDCSGPGGCVASIKPGGEFIAGGNNHDSCFGDSGGPVYLDTPRGPVVVGAVSRGLDGSATPCGGGGIYVRTDKIVEWIETTTGRSVEKDLCGGAGEDTGPDGEDPGNGNGNGNGNGTGNGGGDTGEITGGCSTGGGSAGLFLVGLGLAFSIRRRR
jgi:MYXO-CTERM domain-containing protein